MRDYTFIMYNQEIIISDELARGSKLGFLVKNNSVESAIEESYCRFMSFSASEIISCKHKIILSHVGIYYIRLLDLYYSGCNRDNISLSLFHMLNVNKNMGSRGFDTILKNFNLLISMLAFLEIDARILKDEPDCVNTINKFYDYINHTFSRYIESEHLPGLLDSYKSKIDYFILGTSQTSTLPLRLMNFDSITSSIKNNIKQGRHTFPLRFVDCGCS